MFVWTLDKFVNTARATKVYERFYYIGGPEHYPARWNRLAGIILRRGPEDAGVARGRGSGRFGRLRDAVAGPDGALYVLTNNRDGRGDPRQGDDRILRIEAAK